MNKLAQVEFLELFSFNLIVYIISLLFFSSHHGNPCCCLSIHFVEIFYFEILFFESRTCICIFVHSVMYIHAIYNILESNITVKSDCV